MKAKKLLGITVVLKAPVVIDRELNVLKDGYVVIKDGRTLVCGTQDRLSTPKRSRTIRLKDQVLLPGLVNAHCHLDYTLMKGKIPATGGFASWIWRMIEAKRGWTDADYHDSIQKGIKLSLKQGTTLLANITCVPHLVASLKLDPAPRIWWFAEQIDAGRGASPDPKLWREQLRSGNPLQKFSLSPHAAYSVSPALFEAIVTFCDAQALPWTTHVAESREEYEMFREGSGPLFELLKKLGRDMSDCGAATPFERLLELTRKSRSPGGVTHWKDPGVAHVELDTRAPALLAHMNCLTESDQNLLRKNAGHFSIVHCPRSHAFFKHPAFPLREIHKRGANVCLGTDSAASNQDLNMFSEMRKMKQVFPWVPSRVIVQMATWDGARALGEGESWMNWADWIAVPLNREPFESIIQFADCPKFVMVAGKIVSETKPA